MKTQSYTVLLFLTGLVGAASFSLRHGVAGNSTLAAASAVEEQGTIRARQKSSILDDISMLFKHQEDKTFNAPDSIYFGLTALAVVIPLLLWLVGVHIVAVVFTLNLGLYMAWVMLTYATRNKNYNSGMIVLLSLMIKLLVTLVLWRSWDGTYLELPRVAWQARGPMLQYAVPAGLYAMSDIIRVDVVRATDASTFSILINSRMLFLAFVWQWFMNRKLNLIHWASLLAVLAGCVLKELPHMEHGVGTGAHSRHWAYWEILCLGVITSIATVWNEMLLQKRADVSVNLQNMAMYVWGGLWTLCATIMWAVFSPSHAALPFHADSWRAILEEPLVLLSGVTLALFGVSVAYFLRYLSNITREVTFGAAAPLLSVAMDFFLFKLTLGTLEHIGLVLVLFGVLLFAFKPVLAIDAETEKKDSLSEKVASKNHALVDEAAEEQDADTKPPPGSTSEGKHDGILSTAYKK